MNVAQWRQRGPELSTPEDKDRMDEYRITSAGQLASLWRAVYAEKGKVDWSGLLPFYHPDIVFRDSIQELHGFKDFSAMTARLGRRSRNLEYLIHAALMEGNLIFVEWEMRIGYKQYPTSSVYGSSRLTLQDGKIIYQRDYYDLWGDIFDNIPFFKSAYRRFMRRSFG